ncbi:MAG: ribosome maturation factor RimM [Myxococcaceae bacterium]
MTRSPIRATPATPVTMAVGYVARAHGIDGEVAVRTFDPQSRVLERCTRVWLTAPNAPEQQREARVRQSRKAAKEWLLSLEGVADRTNAEGLKGCEVRVDRALLPPPGPDEFFEGDLIGLTVTDASGERLGTLESIAHTGPVPNLVIRNTSGGELWVPFADPFVVAVKLEAREIVLRPPEEE